MLKFESIEVINFKSIKDQIFNLSNININNSTAAILVGMNESGKSSFLEAISLINEGFAELDYDTYCNIDSQDSDHYIEMYVIYKVTDEKLLKAKLSESSTIDADLIKKINITSITRDIHKNNENGAGESFDITFKDIDYEEYAVVEVKKVVSGIQRTSKTIQKKTHEFNDSTIKPLDKKTLGEFLLNELGKFVFDYFPLIQFWRPSKEYLINDTINLNDFKNDTNISVPLKNIFSIGGKKSSAQLKLIIEKALSNPAKRDKLQEELSEAITKYVNRVWKEHKIKIKVSINSNFCDVLVEDKDKKYSYFNMNQRSDGFKQFISLILSLSTLNESQTLKNNLILIDEPELHLHPSGILYMRDELLKIATNNAVIISTHSQFMIDTDAPERHFIVTKVKGETILEQVDENTNFKDDSVLKSAFGLNLYKELLPKNIIVVEGGDDKTFFNHCLHEYCHNKNFSIKSAGGASKVPTFASLLSGEDLNPLIIFDSDKEGKDNKKKILDCYKESYNQTNVFTLKEINGNLPENSTIEDLYPLDFVLRLLKKEMSKDYNLVQKEAVLIQLKNQDDILKNDKQKLESLKIKLSNSFVKEYDSLDKMQGIERLNDFIVNFKRKLIS